MRGAIRRSFLLALLALAWAAQASAQAALSPARAAKLVDGRFPDGHYKQPTTAVIGAMVADDICRVNFKG